MIGTGSFTMDSFNKEALGELSIALQEKLPIEEKWQKQGAFGAKDASLEEATILQLSLRGNIFLTALAKNVTIKTNKLTEEEDAIVLQALKESGLVKEPSFSIPILASAGHLLLLAVVALLNAGEPVLMGLIGILTVLICLGMVLFRITISSEIAFFRYTSLTILFLGIVLTAPSGLLQMPLFLAIRQENLHRQVTA